MNILDINSLSEFEEIFDSGGYELDEFLVRGYGSLIHTPSGSNVEFIKAWGGGVDSSNDGYEVEGTTYSIIKVGYDYFKIVFSYYSYTGFDFDDIEIYQVRPVEKTVIVYE